MNETKDIRFDDVKLHLGDQELGPPLTEPELPPPLKLVGLDVIQGDLFARAVRAAAKAKTPAAARAALEKLGAVFTDATNFKLAGLEARIAPLDPRLKARENALKASRKAAKRARKARREARRG